MLLSCRAVCSFGQMLWCFGLVLLDAAPVHCSTGHERLREPKQLVADLSLDKTILQNVLLHELGSPPRRVLITRLWVCVAYEVSERRASQFMGMPQPTRRHQGVRKDRPKVCIRVHDLHASACRIWLPAAARLAAVRAFW